MRRRRQQDDDLHNKERWLISYADFITLLFAFFVVMYSVSSVKRKVFIFGLNTPVHQSRITGSMRSATFWCASFRSSK